MGKKQGKKHVAAIGTAAQVADVLEGASSLLQQVEGRDVAGAYDLHSHSVFSDGEFTVDGLIEQARELGLAGLAVTDHDSLTQLSYVRERARALDFSVLAGCEVSTVDRKTGRKVHVLAYGLEATPDSSGPLERIVNQTCYLRSANTLWQAYELQRAGVEFGGKSLSVDEVLRVGEHSTAVFKTHIMEALCGRAKTDPDYQVCWKHYFKAGGIAPRSIEYPSVKKVVRAIREQGGVPVLAHPGQKDSWESVPELVRAGLMGIEAYHPDHSEADVARAFDMAAEYGLFVTGGSDFHGKYSKAPSLGAAFVMPGEAGACVQKLFEVERTLG